MRLQFIAVGIAFAVSCSAVERPSTPPEDGVVVVRPPLATAPGEADRELAARLVDAALTGRAHALLTDLCTTAPRRLSGSAELERAVEWGLATMRELGFANVRAESVMVPHWERGAPERCVRLGADGAEVEELDVLALGGSVATPAEGVTAEVVVVQSFDELAARADEVAGRFVLFNREMPRILRSTFMAYGRSVPQRTSGAAEAAKHGAKGALVRSMTTKLDNVPHTGTMVQQAGAPQIPAAALSTMDADAIAARVAAGEVVRIRLTMDCRTLPDAESANVVGELVGSERPDEIVVVGGHLDSWDVGQGAHDDGAGCVHAIEALRLLSEVGYRPRRTLRAVLFTNEENGLRGGRAYAARHADEVHVAALESDRGGFVPRGFTTSARGPVLDRLQPWADVLDGEGMGALIPGGGGADIAPLAEHGAVLFGLATIAHRYFDYHHSERDRIEAVNERELALGAAACAWLLTVLDRVDLGDASAGPAGLLR